MKQTLQQPHIHTSANSEIETCDICHHHHPHLPMEAPADETLYRLADLYKVFGDPTRIRILYALSGGEKQRVAICRALINNPDLILADEPTGNLDSKSGKIVIDALNKISSEYKKTIVMVTHDPQMASRCKRVIFLKDGLVMNDVRKSGSDEEFYKVIIGEIEKF